MTFFEPHPNPTIKYRKVYYVSAYGFGSTGRAIGGAVIRQKNGSRNMAEAAALKVEAMAEAAMRDKLVLTPICHGGYSTHIPKILCM
jgi:hypothetical protein